MSILCLFVALCVCAMSTTEAFTSNSRFLSSKMMLSQRLYARGEAKVIDPNETEEELMERMRKKARKMMFNENGVAYAPWVSQQVDEDAIIRDLIKKERLSAEGANKKRVSVLDRGEIQSAEGMKWRMKDNQVQLSWVTGGESDNQGYIIEKRPSYGGDFVEVASFTEVANLKSRGATGGGYGYTDPQSSAGSWIYRVQDCDSENNKNVLCQCFVEVETEGESKAQQGVLVGLVGVLLAAVVAGTLLDPAMQ